MLSYVARKRLERAMYYAKDPVLELDAPVPGSEEGTRGDHVADAAPGPDAIVEAADQARLARRMLATLPPREAAVLRLRFGLTAEGDTLTLDSIGRLAGLSRERIRQLEVSALGMLRDRSHLALGARAAAARKAELERWADAWLAEQLEEVLSPCTRLRRLRDPERRAAAEAAIERWSQRERARLNAACRGRRRPGVR